MLWMERRWVHVWTWVSAFAAAHVKQAMPAAQARAKPRAPCLIAGASQLLPFLMPLHSVHAGPQPRGCHPAVLRRAAAHPRSLAAHWASLSNISPGIPLAPITHLFPRGHLQVNALEGPGGGAGGVCNS